MTEREIAADYVRRLTRLKLWYVRWLMDNEGMGFEEAVRGRVNLYRMTILSGDADRGIPEDMDAWEGLLGGLGELYRERRADVDTEAIEAEGLKLLWPQLEPAIERDLRIRDAWLASAIGCFKYEFTKFYGDPESEDYLTLHFRNAYRADSPFHHIPEMADSLREIVPRAEEERPDVTWVQMGSWLNSFPPFAGIFPRSWIDLAEPGRPGSHSGWWGQFEDRRGGFHDRNAREFRATGQFPFRHLLARCPISDLREHLKSLPFPSG